MSEQSNQTDRISARNADPAPASPAAPGTGAASPERRKSTRWRKMLLGAIGVLILAGPVVRHSLGPDNPQHGFNG